MKIINWLSYLTIVSAFSMIVLGTVWSVYPYKPTEIYSIRVKESTVQSGKPLTLEVKYCKYNKITPLISTAFVDGIIQYISDTSLSIPAGCGTNNVIINVPQEMNSGIYAIRRTWVYQVNPVRKIYITRDSNKFEITGSDTKRQLDQK
jgi:hypothetical protein